MRLAGLIDHIHLMPTLMRMHMSRPTAIELNVPIDLDALPKSRLLDDNEAAGALDVSPGTLAVWRSTGRYNLPFVKVGRKVRYRVGDLQDFLASRAKTHTGQA